VNQSIGDAPNGTWILVYPLGIKGSLVMNFEFEMNWEFPENTASQTVLILAPAQVFPWFG
jgi:hypothetical protein